MASVDGGLTVGVVPVSGQLDLKALARASAAAGRAMADVAAAERATGYVAGGISPSARSARTRPWSTRPRSGHPTVFVSGGRRGLDLEIAPADLVAVTGAIVAPIGR